MPALDHIHTYVRVSFKKRNRFRCVHPDCTHRENKEYLEGKRSMCNECGGEFFLDSYALQRSKPKCKNCRNVKTDNVETEDTTTTTDLTKGLGKVKIL